ncbi:MAG: SRPBCC family protein [Pseudonocardiaceae bacterium]
MAEKSTQSIVINADPKAIMDVIADFSGYPQWALAVKKAEVIAPGVGGRAERVRFSVDARLVKDEYVLDYVWSVDLAIPLIGMIRRKAEQVIMDTELKELKRRVEL